ncbi:uncharacterized protein LOC118645060 [Monomorium pharaonis]|uniref:uncharacterized protein LOC118645060 n=1 Tax=Monomorium pharaonis TaxID=307658 RepID=UPI001745D73C|nr:uncharacterized protein LOC118645060 [Monomorium pharaonis]
MESPRIVGNNQQYKIFKFFLNNGSGRRIQIVVWNDDIDKIRHHINLNNIIHLDGVQARSSKVASFNNGNTPFELLIRKNTIVSNLGKYEPTSNLEIEPMAIKLNEIINATQRISKFY